MQNKPTNIKVEGYEQRIAPQAPRQQANVKFAPIYNPAGDIAKSTASLLFALQDKADKLKMQNYEQDLKLLQNDYVRGLQTDNNPDTYETRFKNYEVAVKKLGQDKLGPRLYGKWSQEIGTGYLNQIKQSTEFAKEDALINQSRLLLKDNIDKYATEASLAQTPQERAAIDELVNVSITEALYPKDGTAIINANGAAELKQQYRRSLDLALVNKDLRLQPWAALEKLNNKDEYQGLTPVERQRYIDAANRDIKARENTILEKGTELLSADFENVYARNPFEANIFYQDIINNRKEVIKKYGLDGPKLNTALNYMKAVLDNPNTDFAMANERAKQNMQYKFNQFEIDEDYKIGANNLRNVESAAEFIQQMQSDINNGLYTDKDRLDAQLKIDSVATALGKMVNDSPRLRDSTFNPFTTTASEYLYKKIKDLDDDKDFYGIAFDGEGMSDKDIGFIYENVFTRAVANGIDFKQNNKQVRNTLDNIISESKREYLADKYGIPANEVNSALINGRIINFSGEADNYGEKVNSYLGLYKEEHLPTGGRAMVRRDEKGNIVDIVYGNY